MTTFLLLLVSNVFMTFAWYGHLRHKDVPLWTAVLVSWLIAFVEYCFMVPANRIGYSSGFSAAQLKTLQEVITLSVFCVFAVYYLKEPLRWNVVVGFLFIGLGASFVFNPWMAAPPSTAEGTTPASASETHTRNDPAAEQPGPGPVAGDAGP